MKLSLETVSAFNQIHSYDDESVWVRPQHKTELIRLEESFVLTPEQLVENWQVRDINKLQQQDISALQNWDPEVILFASGSTHSKAFFHIMSELAQHGIGAELMSLGAACRTYNLLVSEERKVVLACFL